jgi:hypothetical protein
MGRRNVDSIFLELIYFIYKRFVVFKSKLYICNPNQNNLITVSQEIATYTELSKGKGAF